MATPAPILEDLPDELLMKIAKLTASAYNSDFRLFDPHVRDPEVGSPRIECGNAGVQFLSAACSRSRGICLPILFSNVVVVSGAIEMENPLYTDQVHSIVLERLPRLLEKRPHIGLIIR